MCATGQVQCSGQCVTLATDPVNCGACGNRCPAVANGTPTCAGGTCGFACDPGFVASGGACVTGEYGTGADGTADVSTTRDLSVVSITGRSTADAPWFRLAGLDSTSTTLTVAPTGITVGDEVMIVNLQGAPGAVARVGNYEFQKVAGVTGSTVRFVGTVANTYGTSSNASLAGQVVAMVRVPNYRAVTVRSGGVITTAAFNGSIGGVLAFRVAGALIVQAGGRIDMAGRGYRGGPTGAVSDQDAYQGESRTGVGCGGQVSSCAGGYLNTACNQCYLANDGGGGAAVTGGGGNYAGGATAGVSWNGGAAAPPSGGGTYGVGNLSQIILGSGGGGVWHGTNFASYVFGPGGNGGGVVWLSALSADLVAGAITAAGAQGIHASQGSWTYGCGGGAGGSIYTRVQTITVVGVAGAATGGPGASAGLIRPGGNGGVGRIRVDARTVNGIAISSGGATTALNVSFEPDPGFIATAP